MINFKKIIVILTLIELFGCGFAQNITSEEPELIFANVIWRHGDRNPLGTYPKDPWKSKRYWPGGYGQLTNIGKQQQYELGQYFRRRYQKLIENQKPIANIVYVQSSEFDRTYMSAAANLAGMFPPEGDQVWNDGLMWQPIPIHVIPIEMDHLISRNRPCPLLLQLGAEYEKSLEYQLLLEKAKNLSKYVGSNTGFHMKMQVYGILYDTLFVEQLKNKTLPDWTKQVYSELETIANKMCIKGSSTPQLARLSDGFLIRDMLDHFRDKIESKLSPDRSLWFYSGHDVTIAGILNALGVFEPHIPPYASSLHFELYKLGDEHYLQIFYRNTSDEYPLPLEIPGCGTKCSLERFVEIYEAIIPNGDFDDECRIPVMTDNFDFNIFASSCLSIFCMVFAVTLICILSKSISRRRNSIRPRFLYSYGNDQL